MTVKQREVILCKVKEMLQVEDVEVILEEQLEVILTPVNNTPIAIKKSAKILFIINNNDAVEYDEEAIAKVLAK